MSTTGACTAAACLKNAAVGSADSGASSPCSSSTQSNATAPPAKHARAASTLFAVLTAGQSRARRLHREGRQRGSAGCRAAALRYHHGGGAAHQLKAARTQLAC